MNTRSSAPICASGMNCAGTITTSCASASLSAAVAGTSRPPIVGTGRPSCDRIAMSNSRLFTTSRLRAFIVPASSSSSCVRNT